MAMHFNRRTMLRGMLGGSAVCLGIPALDVFVDVNGKAWADGAKFSTRFGTYFWGLGLTDTPSGGSRWVPRKKGFDYDIPPELGSIADLRDKVSVFSGFDVKPEGRPNIVHWSGHAAILSGIAPAKSGIMDGPSFDTKVADHLGATTRFKAIDLSASGDHAASHSTRTGRAYATPETSALALYKRLFGEGFQDPNDPNWEPNAQVMLQKSVLSGVSEQRAALLSEVGRADQIKLDQYFTSLRQIEKQLEMQLQKPEPCEACEIPDAPPELAKSTTVDVVEANCIAMARLLAMGLACNQTNVFNMVHTPGNSNTYLAGERKIYHTITHDEPTDSALGYQPKTSELAGLVMKSFGAFIKELDAIQEGDGTLLDHTLVMAFSDTGYAKIHALENIPILFAGGANGQHRAGQHIVGNGSSATRLSLTAQQIVGAPVGEFGAGAMRTSLPVTEVMA